MGTGDGVGVGDGQSETVGVGVGSDEVLRPASETGEGQLVTGVDAAATGTTGELGTGEVATNTVTMGVAVGVGSRVDVGEGCGAGVGVGAVARLTDKPGSCGSCAGAGNGVGVGVVRSVRSVKAGAEAVTRCPASAVGRLPPSVPASAIPAQSPPMSAAVVTATAMGRRTNSARRAVNPGCLVDARRGPSPEDS